MGFDGITDGKFKINNKDFYNSLCDELNLQGEQRQQINLIWGNIQKTIQEATDKDFNNVNQNEELDLNQMKCKDGQTLWQRILRMVENTLGDRSYLELKPKQNITEEYSELGQLKRSTFFEDGKEVSFTNYKYNDKGYLLSYVHESHIYPKENESHYIYYDNNDRVKLVAHDYNNNGSAEYTHEYEYDGNNNIIKHKYYSTSRSYVTKYEYDKNNNIKKSFYCDEKGNALEYEKYTYNKENLIVKVEYFKVGDKKPYDVEVPESPYRIEIKPEN